MSDSRIDKIRASWPDDDMDAASLHLRFIESAGLLVVDPADPAVIDRAAQNLVGSGRVSCGDCVYPSWWTCPQCRQAATDDVAAVVAALGGDR